MDYEAMFNEALTMFNNGDREEAAELFEKVGRETNSESALGNAARAYYTLAMADRTMAKQGVIDEEMSLESVTKAIDVLKYGFENEILPWDEYSSLLGECSAIKGFLLYMLNKPECEVPLKQAVGLGDNQSRVLLGLWYKDVAGALIDAGDEDAIPQIKEAYSNMANVLEDYITYYNPDEAESDEFRLACSLVANEYRSGLSIPADLEKAAKYEALAANFDEATKTSTLPSSNADDSGKKKKGLFGFLK